MKRVLPAGSSSFSGSDWLRNSSYYRNQRITFQQNTVSNDEYENQVQTWVDYFTCWAYANTLQTSETDTDIPQDQETITFETRYCPELGVVDSTNYRIKYNGKLYDILSVDQMNYQYRTLKFRCSLERQHLQPDSE